VSDARPRVIFVNRVYWPSQAATAQLLTDLAEGLAARGWCVHVIAAGTEPGPRNGVVIHRTGPGEQHGGLLSRALNYGRFNRRARQLLAGLAQAGDVVVPMTDPPMLGARLAATAQAAGARVVHWIQDIYPEILTAHLGGIAALPTWPLRRQRDAAWLSADRCVTLGSDMARLIAARGVPPGRITVVPNWAPRELQVQPDAFDVTARRVIWKLADKFIVVYSGNLGRVHEFKTVLAAARLLRERTGIIFLFIGTGARFEEIRTTAEAGKLYNIRFLPPEPRENLATALAAADAHLVTLKPAFADLVYPSKLAGVLAAGRPALFVGPPDGDIARLLAAEGCGQAAAPGDGRRLAEIISQWQGAPGRRVELGRRARAAYEKHFTFARSLASWEEILRSAGASP
jgi:glycosyltransferase involved in cell wall biosynthesis